MKYKVRNTSSFIRIFAHNAYGLGMFPIDPGQTTVLSDTAVDTLVTTYPGLLEILGPTLDSEAPVQLKVTTPTSWTLVTLGRPCAVLQFIPSAAGIQISYSGWDSPAAAPPTANIIDVPTVTSTETAEMFTIDQSGNFNLTQTLYVKGTTGSETLTILGY